MTKKDNDERIQSEAISSALPTEEEIEEPTPPINIQNLCSWLLIFTPEELSILSSIFAIIIANNFTIEENSVIGSFLTALADNIFLIAAQLTLYKAADDERKEIEELKKQKLEKQKEKLQKKAE